MADSPETPEITGYQAKTNVEPIFAARPVPPTPTEAAEFGSDQWVEDTLRYIHQVAKSPALLNAANTYKKKLPGEEA